MVQQYSPDLVIFDIDMPVMDGIEVFKTVIAKTLFAVTPVVIIIGHDTQTLKLAVVLGAGNSLRNHIDIEVFDKSIVCDRFIKNSIK